eukprot:1341805-Amorphochlora_amoeboformis.AAC.1
MKPPTGGTAAPDGNHEASIPLRTFTAEELSKYDGKQSDDSPIYLAVDGIVFDVSAGRNYYGV